MEEEKKYQLSLQQTVSKRPGSIHDAVFGGVVEGGPNYRNVMIVPLCLWTDANFTKARLDRNHFLDDENTNRSRCPLDSFSI